MSFTSKPIGRDFLSRSNSNPNKVQTMSYRNSLTNQHHSNSSNGETYLYEDKSQHQSGITPKVVTDSQGIQQQQHNTSPREVYPYKNNNSRPKQYNTNKNYNDKHINYYGHRSNSPEETAIPEIDHLREFVKEQTDRFKIELARHEGQKSNSPSPGGHHYNDQSNFKYNKQYSSLGRATNGLPVSHSLGSIANSGSSNIGGATVPNLTVSPSQCSDNNGRHPDARMTQQQQQQQNNYVVRNNSGGGNYNKYPSSSSQQSSSGKPSPGLTKNHSYEESTIVGKNRNDSPNNNSQNNVENQKSFGNKMSFLSASGSSVAGGRQDSKKVVFKTKPFSYATGSNAAMHQLNQNNAVTANSLVNENHRKVDHQLNRPTMSSVVRNGAQRTTANRRRPDCGGGGPGSSEGDSVPSYRAVVSVADTSRGGSTTDSQDVADLTSALHQEHFFTPDPPASPCSARSSPDTTTSFNNCPSRVTTTARKPAVKVAVSTNQEHQQ